MPDQSVNPSFDVPQIGATYVSFGILVDGGGIVIVGGKPVPVSPWGPLYALGSSLAAFHAASLIGEAGKELQTAALNTAKSQLSQLERSVVG